jgi:hypothetical protein
MAKAAENTETEDEELLTGQTVFKGPRLRKWLSGDDS